MHEDNIRARRIYRITLWGMAVNLLLFVFKLVSGIVGRSGAMIADAIHSASDMITDVVVIVCVRLSSTPQDDDHDWGHGKYETLATAIIGASLAYVGIEIIIHSIGTFHDIVSGEGCRRPGVVALVAAAISIITKEILFHVTRRVGRETSSPSVVANAWHHRSDALSSVATLVGVGLAYFLGEKWMIADPIAAMAVAIMILKVAYNMVRQSIGDITEKSLPEETESEIIHIIQSESAVSQPHNLRTRRVGSAIAIEVHIRVDGNMTVLSSHQVTKRIEARLKSRFGDNTFIAIHVEPKK